MTPCPDASREELIARVLAALIVGPEFGHEIPVGTCIYCARILPFAFHVEDHRATAKTKSIFLAANDPQLAEYRKLKDDPRNSVEIWIWAIKSCEAAQDRDIYQAAIARKNQRTWGKKPEPDKPLPPRRGGSGVRNPYGSND